MIHRLAQRFLTKTQLQSQCLEETKNTLPVLPRVVGFLRRERPRFGRGPWVRLRLPWPVAAIRRRKTL